MEHSVILMLLALQTAGVACTPAELCRTLEAAVAANQALARAASRYRAVVETESATLNRWEGRVEGAAILEQASSTVRWSPDGRFQQHIGGWRSSTNAVPLTRMAILRIGWLVPTTSGERLMILSRSGPVQNGVEMPASSPALRIVVHPLAADRASFYRFSGGAEVLRTIDGTARRVLAIEVTPAVAGATAELRFKGEMDLDPETHALVRLFGHVTGMKPRRSGPLSLVLSAEPAVTMVELVNQRLPDGSWVPSVQRFEIESISKRTWGFGAALRVISRFHDAEPLPGSQAGGAGGGAGIGDSLSSAPRDSLRRFRGWRAPAGRMTDAVTADDFARFRGARIRSDGRPVVTVQGYFPGEFLRLNKVEGVYTGVSLLARLRDAAPGLAFHVTGGYAWHEKTFRGRGGVGWRRGPWSLEAGGGRILDVTNKFRNQFDNPVLGALVGRDNWDYLDRVGGGLFLTRRLGGSGSVARLDVAALEDRALTRQMTKSLAGWRLRENRGITGGTYFRTRALLELNPEVSPVFAKDGIGFRGEVERAGGDLDYTRVEAHVVGRASLRRVTFLARLHAGAVFADVPPPQQLFEIGGPAGLSGYDYKEFAGDRAMLFRTRITYALPMLDTRRRLTSGATRPALAPAISIGFSAGIADVRTPGGAASVAKLGLKRNDKTGALVTDPLSGLPLPASVASGKMHPSVDVRLGFFGDALAVGFARGLERGRKTLFIFAFGRQF